MPTSCLNALYLPLPNPPANCFDVNTEILCRFIRAEEIFVGDYLFQPVTHFFLIPGLMIRRRDCVVFSGSEGLCNAGT